jgi:signal transduction histidine kinase
MQSSIIPRSEELLGNLIHDLRQPLGNIETGAYLLTLVTPPEQTGTHAQLLAIERQVHQAARLLSEACAALAGLRAQRLEAAEPLAGRCVTGEPLAGRQGAETGEYPAKAYFKGEVMRPECVAGESFDLTKPATAAVT